MYAEAAPEGVAHPVGEGDRRGEGEACGEFGEGEHEDRYAGESLSLLQFNKIVKPLLADTFILRRIEPDNDRLSNKCLPFFKHEAIYLFQILDLSAISDVAFHRRCRTGSPLAYPSNVFPVFIKNKYIVGMEYMRGLSYAF